MDGSNGEIVTVDLSRATVSRVTTSPASEDNPLWTPDGRQLVYEARTADQTSLFSMNADGTGEAQTLYSVPDALGLVPSGWGRWRAKPPVLPSETPDRQRVGCPSTRRSGSLGTVSRRWHGVLGQGEPHLNTALAVLTLLNAGRDTPIIDRAIDYLISEQNALGGFDEATFFVGRTDGDQVFEFTSASFTTAMALEALVRHELGHCSRFRGPSEAGARRCCMVRPRNRSGVAGADDHAVTAEDCAVPSANIVFSTVHPTIASRCCASNPFARRLPPRIRLYRRNVPSTRACCR